MLEWAKSSSKTFSKPEQHPDTFDPEIGNGRGGLTIGAKDQGPFPNKTTKPDLVLPEGWEYIWSDTQQKWYYWNTKTGKSAWKPPRAKAVAAAPS